MISADNPLDSVWQTYLTTKDCLKIADKVRKRNDLQILESTKFIGMIEHEAFEELRACHAELDNLVIVSLWAVFERFLIEYVQARCTVLKTLEPTDFGLHLYDQFASAVEQWRLSDTLDLFKGPIDSARLGDAKNIKKHRDYIAHRNPKKKPEGGATPRVVYETLSQLMERIRVSW